MQHLLQYALEAESKILVHVDTVTNGLACGCTCPECGERLIAKNGGNILIHHFAHLSGTDCGGARMSALHLLAQQIIAEKRSILLPTYSSSYYYKEPQLITFDEVKMEVYDKESLRRPDCVGYITRNGKTSELWIEILVTHRVDEEKKRDIENVNRSCIEVDLSNLLGTEFTTEQVLERLLQDTHHKKWISSPVLDKRAETERIKAFEEQKKQEFQRQEKERKKEEWKHNEAEKFVQQFIDRKKDETKFSEDLEQFAQTKSMRNLVLQKVVSFFASLFFHQRDTTFEEEGFYYTFFKHLPEDFPINDLFEKQYYDRGDFCDFMDVPNDLPEQKRMFHLVLSQLFRKYHSYVRYYSWDDRDYYSMLDHIELKLNKLAQKEARLTQEQSNQMERYALAWCYQKIYDYSKLHFLGREKTEELYSIIENDRNWRVIVRLISVYFNRIIGCAYTNYAQLTEDMFKNYPEYSHWYVRMANTKAGKRNNYCNKNGENKLDKYNPHNEHSSKLDELLNILLPIQY